MPFAIKSLAKAVIARTPYRIVRDLGANRFQAIPAALRNMRQRGFLPDVVIDGGAHLGEFTLSTKKLFPNASYHMIEPQPACLDALQALCSLRKVLLYPVALSDTSGTARITKADGPNTGVHVSVSGDGDDIDVPCATLDSLFPDLVQSGKRVMLKMDLQGYELHALRGAHEILPSVEVILTEVSFFAQAYEPTIAVLVDFLDRNGFMLYDIAALAGRTRDNRLRQGDFVFVRKGSPLTRDGSWA